jgi:FtsH-binding integral membrane protein
MEMSIKDRLSILAMSIIGMIIYLLIAYDPLDILDTSQKWIIAVIVSIAFAVLLFYQVQRIKKKMKKPT